jgi:hypothetical protein
MSSYRVYCRLDGVLDSDTLAQLALNWIARLGSPQ